MSAVAETEVFAADDRLAKRNAWVLAVAQALAGGNNTVIAATAGIIGSVLAPDKGLATLPVSVMVVGIWFGTLPLGYLAGNFGRRFALQTGSVVGTLAGLVSCVAVIQGSFILFLVGTFGCGFYAAALAGLVLTQFKSMPVVRREQHEDGRSLGTIARNPLFVVAVVCGVASFALMNLIMTSAPLAMVDCGHSVTDAALGIQWHVLGMYAPSFVTGFLILRFGVFRVMGAGLALFFASGVIGIAGVTVAHFWIALALLGVGWNFAFIAATTLVTQCHRPEERNRVQAFNDFLIFGTMALGSFASGKVLATLGWVALNVLMFPPVLAAGALVAWIALRIRAQAV